MIRLFPSSLPPWHQSLLLQGIDTKELDLIATGDGGFVMMENTFPGKQFQKALLFKVDKEVNFVWGRRSNDISKKIDNGEVTVAGAGGSC